jgi:tRNA(Ile2) C34 agmatinyltransferase TiaS
MPKCTVCSDNMREAGSGRGYWYWCRTCGSLHVEVNGNEVQLVETPAVFRLSRMENPRP